MSRKVINTFFLIGSCLHIPGIALIIWAYTFFFQSITQFPYSPSTNPFDSFSTFMGFYGVGMLLITLGGLIVLVALIGALIEAAQAKEWVWFVLMLLFGWIVLLVYLVVVPQPKPVPQYAAYPYPHAAPGQFWSGYPGQAPGMMPPSAQPWPGYAAQAPGMMPPSTQPWTGYAAQAPGMMPPSTQPWPGYPPPEQQQDIRNQPKE